MAVAFVQEFKIVGDDRTTTNYDAVSVRVQAQSAGPIKGLLIHTAGFDEDAGVFHNVAIKNCEGILVLDDGQKGGAGNAAILRNVAAANNKFCPKSADTPVSTQGGGILLLGATHTLVAHNAVSGNAGAQFNSGGIVVLSASKISHGSNPNHDTIAANHAFHNRPADLIWDGTGVGGVGDDLQVAPVGHHSNKARRAGQPQPADRAVGCVRAAGLGSEVRHG